MVGKLMLHVSSDLMAASAYVDEGNDEITVDFIKKMLENTGITAGILQEEVEKLAGCETYKTKFMVAKGKAPGATTPGYFVYYVDNSEHDGKPTIMEDGKVNYGQNRVMVKKGTQLCEYHPSVSGSFGYTVYGDVIAPKPTQDKMLEAGEGVEIRDNIYYATVDGEVIMNHKHVRINSVLVIDGDARYAIDTNTKFVGDVHVKGDVLTGVNIIADGSVEIDGNVEVSHIKAGKDIIIRGGIKGGMTAKLEAEGNITCVYIENANLHAGQSIFADYVLMSKLEAGEDIYIQGPTSQMIGGKAIAGKSIICGILGNESEVTTVLEIKGKEDDEFELNKIVLKMSAFPKAVIMFNGVASQNLLVADKEYHFVDDIIKRCEIGKYVPKHKKEIPVGPQKKVVMIVDDEPIVLKTHLQYLMDDYDMMVATSAREAKVQLEGRVPDLILLDYQMPGMNGAEFLASVRASENKPYANVPVFFVTAINDKEVIKRCLTLYPQGYMLKPVTKENMQETVKNFFESM